MVVAVLPVYAGLYGAALAVVPSLIGSVILTALLVHRHSTSTDPALVRRDLTIVMVTSVAVLDLVVLIVIAVVGSLMSAVILVLMFENLVLMLMLRRAHRFLLRAWLRLAGSGPPAIWGSQPA